MLLGHFHHSVKDPGDSPGSMLNLVPPSLNAMQPAVAKASTALGLDLCPEFMRDGGGPDFYFTFHNNFCQF